MSGTVVGYLESYFATIRGSANLSRWELLNAFCMRKLSLCRSVLKPDLAFFSAFSLT